MTGGMVYNGFDFGPYLKANPHRSLVPPTAVAVDEVPGRDGTRFRSARLGELSIVVDVELRAGRREDVAELRHRLAARLWSPAPAPLFLPDDPYRYHMAVLDGQSDLDVLWRTGQAQLTFRAPDPVMYGAERQAELSGETAVHVGGNRPTYPVIEAAPTGKSFRIEAPGGTVEVLAEGSFDGSKTLLIDCGACHCELAGLNADGRVALSSDYFALEPGENALVATGGSGTIRWIERWI